MTEALLSSDNSGPPVANPRPLPPGRLADYPWLTFLLPILVFMLVGSFEPRPPKPLKLDANAAEPDDSDADENAAEGEPVDEGMIDAATRSIGIEYRHYPLIYTIKIVLTSLVMLWVLPGYRTFPWKVHWLSVAVGVIGGIAWIVLCKLHLEQQVISLVKELLDMEKDKEVELGQRSGFDPLKELADNPAWAYGFLAIRLFGLVLVVPVMEEFFLRGFVMRYVVDPEWWKLPFGRVNTAAIVAGTAVPMLMHLGGELIAAAVWFSAVTWLMLRTKSIWDCVVAHAITNLMLGLYVIWSAQSAPPGQQGDWWLM